LLGAAQALRSLAALVAAPAAGRLLDAVGHGPVLAGAGVVGALGALAFGGVRVLEPKPPARLSPWRLVRTALRNRHFRGYVLGYNLMGLGAGILTPTIPVVLVDRLDVSFSTLGLLVLVQGLTATVCYVAWGRVVDRWSGAHATFVGMLTFAAVPVLFMLAVSLGTVWVLPAAYFLSGLASAGYALGWQAALMSMAAPERTAPLATTFFISVGLLGMGGPSLGGLLLLAGGPPAALSATLGLVLAGGAVMMRTARHFPRLADKPGD
jgi:MFS family permease